MNLENILVNLTITKATMIYICCFYVISLYSPINFVIYCALNFNKTVDFIISGM